MAWQNAPALKKLAASQLPGKNGAQIWGVDNRGRLYTNYQITPGGGWDGWLTNSWCHGGYPDPVYELCASQAYGGETMLWLLDMKHQLWCIAQDKSGNWLGWQGPNWLNLPDRAKPLKKMAAMWPGVKFGARFWGITDSGKMISLSHDPVSGAWGTGRLEDWPETPKDLTRNPPVLPAEWIEVTACSQGADGKGALWALDTKMQLWAMFQEAPGGKWGPWLGPNWKNAPKLRNIAAVDMSAPSSPGSRDIVLGACIFGITNDYKIVYSNQSRPGFDDWWGWEVASFKDTLRGYEITAARQNNKSARVWVISNDGVLVSQQVNVNSSPPGWERFWTPEEP
jgi:hypothetical protein